MAVGPARLLVNNKNGLQNAKAQITNMAISKSGELRFVIFIRLGMALSLINRLFAQHFYQSAIDALGYVNNFVF